MDREDRNLNGGKKQTVCHRLSKGRPTSRKLSLVMSFALVEHISSLHLFVFCTIAAQG